MWLCSDWNMIADIFYLIFLPFAWLTLKSVLIHHPLYFQISLLKMTWLKQPSFLCLKKKSKHLSWILWQKKMIKLVWTLWTVWVTTHNQRVYESSSPKTRFDSDSTSIHLNGGLSGVWNQVESSQAKLDNLAKKKDLWKPNLPFNLMISYMYSIKKEKKKIVILIDCVSKSD